MSTSAYPPQRVLVMGGGDVGSAVAHHLFRAGARVVLCDLPHSAHARRGMAYTDALFEGSAVLEGVEARRVDDVAQIERCWERRDAIPLIAMPDRELVARLPVDVVVDATMRRSRAPEDLRSLAPVTVGLGPGFRVGGNCHIAIETQWGERMGAVLRSGATAPLAGGPKALDGVTRERFVEAPVTGLWRSAAVIGAPVRAAQVLGHLAGDPICAPIDGHLRGVAHDGVQVRAGQRIVEVDPRESPQIFGLGERPDAVARGVLTALGLTFAS